MCCYSGALAPEFHSCRLPFSWHGCIRGNLQPYTNVVTDEEKDLQPQATPQRDPTKDRREGPSWGFMLGLIALAMVVALAIAWAFIHPLLNRHY
jgi:hypothetical protein